MNQQNNINNNLNNSDIIFNKLYDTDKKIKESTKILSKIMLQLDKYKFKN